jgi:hypothetical protein
MERSGGEEEAADTDERTEGMAAGVMAGSTEVTADIIVATVGALIVGMADPTVEMAGMEGTVVAAMGAMVVALTTTAVGMVGEAVVVVADGEVVVDTKMPPFNCYIHVTVCPNTYVVFVKIWPTIPGVFCGHAMIRLQRYVTDNASLDMSNILSRDPRQPPIPLTKQSIWNEIFRVGSAFDAYFTTESLSTKAKTVADAGVEPTTLALLAPRSNQLS